MRNARLVQPSRQPGGRVQARHIGPVGPVLGPRVALHHRERQGHRTVGGSHRGQPVTRVLYQSAQVEVARSVLAPVPSGHEEDVESALDVDGKACRAALVGFEAVTETPVRISVGTDGIDHAGNGGVVEQHRGEAALDEPPVTVEERPSSSHDVIGHERQSGTGDQAVPEPGRADCRAHSGLPVIGGSVRQGGPSGSRQIRAGAIAGRDMCVRWAYSAESAPSACQGGPARSMPRMSMACRRPFGN